MNLMQVIAVVAALTALAVLPAVADAPAASKPKFSVIAFYTGKNDLAHIAFVNEAVKWFPDTGKKYGFAFDSTNDWTKLNADTLSHYQVVMFLDTRPEDPAQRAAF